MKQYEIAEKLASIMQQEGCELDACDRLIIRKTISGALTAQRHRVNRAISTGQTYRWRIPDKPRR